MLRAPLAVGPGHSLQGKLVFEANESRGYNVHMTCTNANTGVTLTNTVVTQCALHHFQYATSSATNNYYPPPVAATAAPAPSTSDSSDVAMQSETSGSAV